MRISDWSSDVCSSDLFRIKANGGISKEGDDERPEVTASWGTKFNDDRGYFLVSGTYDERWGIAATDRPFALIEADFDYNTRSEERRIGQECDSPCRSR